jgi:hypothetical protein
VSVKEKKYLQLENLSRDQQGHTWQPLADAKLAGALEYKVDFNPIAHQGEMLVTRGVKKWWVDYKQMQMAAYSSPGYMIAVGRRCTRLLHYRESEKKLLALLAECTLEQLNKFHNALYELMIILHNSPVALIGASILILKQEDGTIKPMLIDPAHMIVDRERSDDLERHFLEEECPKIYYGDQKAFWEQKTSNHVGINALINAVERAKAISSAHKRFDESAADVVQSS